MLFLILTTTSSYKLQEKVKLMPNHKKWTLKSIANELGVSNATVSNAFNRPDQLSEKKRIEILEACAKLGYYGPNKAAQSLRKGKFNIVALVLPDSVEYMVSDPVASHFVTGVSSILEKEKINILLFSGSSENLNDIADLVDGFICYGQPRQSLLIEQLKQSKKKVVTVDFNIERKAAVSVNKEQAAYEVAKKALGTKSEQVAIMGLRLLDTRLTCRVYDQPDIDVTSSISHQRLKGYHKAIAEVGAELLPDRTWNIPESNPHFAQIAAREALSSSPRPQVMLCMSDLIALTVIREASEQGIKIPEQLKVVGFDGIEEGQRNIPQLTTVHQNSAQKGKLAAEMFLSDASHGAVIDYEILTGASS